MKFYKIANMALTFVSKVKEGVTLACLVAGEKDNEQVLDSLKKRVKKLEKRNRIDAIDTDDDITLLSVYDDANNEMFDVDDLGGEEMFVVEQNDNVVEEVVNDAQVSTATTTTEEITLKTSKPKKDQIRLDEEATFKLQAEFDEEERLVANVFVVKTSLDCFGYFDLRLRSSIMGEPLSPDRIFDFPMDESKPHLAYDFFAPGPLSRYAGNPNNNNGCIEVDVPLLGELGAEVDEPMIDQVIDEFVEPIAEGEEHVISLVIDEVNEEWLMAPVTPPLMPVIPQPSTYKVRGPSTATAEGQSFTLSAPGFPVHSLVIEDLSTRMGNLEYRHGQLVKKVIQVSDAEVDDGITIGEIGPRVSAIEGQAAVQQRDVRIQQLQTMVSKISRRESTLMQCILGMDKRLADLKRRPPGPQ
uniref:Uncharacterized protein n=1 Tax=Tanacetum cinerariifolium TaxID=118510 RepID=A0A6L2MPT6_TANCI|nr:hypothetical protein [Tanacetum cinerariifolium]